MKDFHMRAATALAALNAILGDEYVLTLVCRNKVNENAHIVVSADEYEAAIEVLEGEHLQTSRELVQSDVLKELVGLQDG